MSQDQAPNPSRQNKTPDAPLSPPLPGQGSPFYHYVIVRADLPRGLQAAQIVHAAGESAANSEVPDGTHAVVLQVNDEEHLLGVAEKLWWAGIENYKLIIEPDLPLFEDRPLQDGQGTAIGIPPTADRKKIAAVLGRLPLLR
ncbi:MAG: peptidyl-tRNA hydrolase [Nitrospira sp.]